MLPSSNSLAWQAKLHSALDAHQAIWRPAPFHLRRPGWCADWPELADAVLRLDEQTLDRLSHHPRAAHDWLAPLLPVVRLLDDLTRLPRLPLRSPPPTSARFDAGVPHRKRAQVEAFAAHTFPARTPLLDWCAGKGHLGRRLAVADRVPVHSLEIDPRLCAEAGRLAGRAGADQTVVCADALDELSHEYVEGRSVLALHACGPLHRKLVERAAHAGARSYLISPCCYHSGVSGTYEPFAAQAALPLDAGAMRLAVTETVTAPSHVRRRLARDQAWKLGFIALRDSLEGEAVRTFRPVPARWLAGDFAAFCQALARRENVKLPSGIDWSHWVAAGERRRAEVRRLELVRHAFRRALELWLGLDLAAGLETAGFDVRVGAFCERSLTPRNLVVRASR
ncbi:class I SAM-dependent methyltransferase [Flindersiella endophytica]